LNGPATGGKLAVSTPSVPRLSCSTVSLTTVYTLGAQSAARHIQHSLRLPHGLRFRDRAEVIRSAIFKA